MPNDNSGCDWIICDMQRGSKHGEIGVHNHNEIGSLSLQKFKFPEASF